MKTILLLFLGWVICAFGQPWLNHPLALLAGAGGYACVFLVLLDFPNNKKRFLLGTAWFAAVQAVQFLWFLSHPFLYIYGVYALLITIYAVQFGLLSLWITKKTLGNIWGALTIPSFWVLMEWTRLFLFSGIAFNSVGLPLSAHIYSLQWASVAGILGLSFWVILTAVLLARRSYILWGVAALVPFIFGIAQLKHYSENEMDKSPTMHALLVQPGFPVEETLQFNSANSFLGYVLGEWNQILKITSPYKENQYDLIAMPEMVVPFGAYMLAYPHEKALKLFKDNYGEEILAYLPKASPPFGQEGYVNNAYFAQSLSNIFKAPVLTGMEDIDYLPNDERQLYSAALLFTPFEDKKSSPKIERYEKRVLVPMGEYIPFTALADLARSYGISGSFTPGQETKVMQCGKFSISPNICYDETFGSLTKDCCAKGAHVLVNVSNDAWFPAITKVHMEHARLRTVEGGLPLLRACNTGVTCAINSFGETIAELEDGAFSGALSVKLPIKKYTTPYSKWGDLPLLVFSALVCVGYGFYRFRG